MSSEDQAGGGDASGGGPGSRPGSSAGSGPGAGPGPGPGASESRRRALVWDTALGFVGFLTALAVLQAVLNVFRADPAIWPGLFALVMVLATWLVWKGRARYSD